MSRLFFIAVISAVLVVNPVNARNIEINNIDDAMYELKKLNRKYNKQGKRCNKMSDRCNKLQNTYNELVSKYNKQNGVIKNFQENHNENIKKLKNHYEKLLDKKNKKLTKVSNQLERAKNKSQYTDNTKTEYREYREVVLKHYMSKADKHLEQKNFPKAIDNYAIVEELMTVYEFNKAIVSGDLEKHIAIISAKKIIVYTHYIISMAKNNKASNAAIIKKNLVALATAMGNSYFQEDIFSHIRHFKRRNKPVNGLEFVHEAANVLKNHNAMTEQLSSFISKMPTK